MGARKNGVGLFFVVEGKILLHTCAQDEAVAQDGVLTFPESHEQVWERYYREQYGVDYNYFPRGRIVYVKKHDYFILYCNQCSHWAALELYSSYREKNCQLAYDLSYRCHQCRPSGSRLLRRLRRRLGV